MASLVGDGAAGSMAQPSVPGVGLIQKPHVPAYVVKATGERSEGHWLCEEPGLPAARPAAPVGSTSQPSDVTSCDGFDSQRHGPFQSLRWVFWKKRL